MYAAAGGAALSSRKARQRQNQNTKTEKLAAIKTKSEKTGAAIAAAKAPTQSKQFHNLPANYHTTGIKLSRVERNALKTVADRRHSTANHLKGPARARIKESPSILLPLQNHHHHQKGQPLTPTTLVQNHIPVSPSMCQLPQGVVPPDVDADQIHDPDRRCSLVRQYEEAAEQAEKEAEEAKTTSNHVYCFEMREMGPDGNPLMYSELDRAMFGSMDYPFSESNVEGGDQKGKEKEKERKRSLASDQESDEDLLMQIPRNGPSCLSRNNKCSQGRAAWQERERERRCSLTEAAQNHRVKQTEAHHRWMKRNRIHDTSYGGSSDEEDFFSIYYQSAAANALLYVGLGTTVIGLVIWFVGTGEKGFKTLELRLIGPTLIALGLACCVIRVLLCICPSTCLRRRKKTRLKNSCPHSYSNKEPRRDPPAPTEDFVMVDHNTTLLKSKKRVSIAPNPVPCSSTSGDFHHHHQPPHIHQMQPHHHHHHHHHHEQAQRRDSLVAATTVFLQHEKERSTVSKPIPIIEIPDFADFNGTNSNGNARLKKDDSLIELQNLELSSLDVSSVSSCDSDSITIIEAEITEAPSKLMRSRQPSKLSTSSHVKSGRETASGDDVTETSLSTTTTAKSVGVATVVPHQHHKGSHSGIVLSPSKLGQ